ncbi:hypothetical protein MLD38_035431 [Melastoma candidum]|uniref:Uncharacterized protein n=1 Tax=Melastoma candidum TaxID=119954 RepID=A0ACB9LGW8_9MYRT|nr:hypothetical protein MLD38_035431 [Melastoma candidum]
MEEMEALHGTVMAKIWRDALWKGGDLIGESVQDGEDEGPVVKRTVKKVLKILNRVPMEVAKYPTGINSRLEDVKPLLHMTPHVDEVFMTGIHGIGGGGKTTLAKAICNDIADNFDDWCFLQDVRTTDLVLSQQTLLRQLLREPDLIVPSVDQGKHLIKERLCHKRVLVILDNLDSSDQLDALAGGCDWFDDVVPENYAVKGIVLDLAKKQKKLIKSNTFKFSRRLRLLIVRNAFDPKEPLNFPSELRWLEWPAYSASTVSYGDFSQLVGLDMQRSYIKELTESNLHEEEEEEQEFTELKYVNLSSCESLVTLPDLSKSLKLQELNLLGCKNLTGINEAIGSLDELIHLNLGLCHNLSTYPSSLKSKHFQTLNFSGCFKLIQFPDIEEELEYLEELHLEGTAVKELPDSIINLVAVKVLGMDSCKELSFIPTSISRLEKLEDLLLRRCENLEEVRGLPPHLVRLHMEDCQRVRTLPRLHTFMSRTQRIHYVNLSGCQNLGSAYMNESLPYQMVRKFQGVSIVILPADEIPIWMNFQTTDCRSEFQIALPEGMVEDDILGLALSITFEVEPWAMNDPFKFVDCVLSCKTIGGIYMNQWKSAHTWFTYRPRQPNADVDEEDFAGGTDWSNITFRFLGTGVTLKKCGVHVVCKKEQDDLKFVVHGKRRESDSEFDFF